MGNTQITHPTLPPSSTNSSPVISAASATAGYGYGVGGNANEVNQYFFHPDHLGSATYITGKDGQVRQHIEYTAFGETFLEEHTSSDNLPYLYNGKELDGETGLYYYGARYYDSVSSMWASVDPMAEKFLYRTPYCFSGTNPLAFIDPTGMEEKAVDSSAPENLSQSISERFVDNLANQQTGIEKGSGKTNVGIKKQKLYFENYESKRVFQGNLRLNGMGESVKSLKSISEAIGKRILPVDMLMDAISFIQSIQKNGVGRGLVGFIGEQAGQWTGAQVGAIGGATIGMKICGPRCAIGGGIVGGLLGGNMGGGWGKQTALDQYDGIENMMFEGYNKLRPNLQRSSYPW